MFDEEGGERLEEQQFGKESKLLQLFIPNNYVSDLRMDGLFRDAIASVSTYRRLNKMAIFYYMKSNSIF